jgi:predicted nucleic acid-binding protein
MLNPPYVDTSALAKLYLNELRSQDFEEYIARSLPVAISRLTVLELRCLLARRRRAGEIDARLERDAFAAFEGDVRNGALTVRPLEDAHAAAALQILVRLKAQPLRSLDAMHLAIALDIGATEIATADRVMATAAAALGLKTARFD